jgi:FkbM family methyltransferase
MKSRLSVHHIGGRDGTRGFPDVAAFEKDIVNVLYDADPGCVEHARKQNASLASELHVLPYCLAEACKSAQFHFNYDPTTSSTYEFNPDCASFYLWYGDHDYVMGEAAEQIENRQVETVSLDHIFQSKKSEVQPPDFLSLDTQVSEYDIFNGGRETLKGVLGIYCEVEFHPLYRGQPLFGDVQRQLSELGFDFVGFANSYGMSNYRAPIGLRGEGFHVVSDALFLRSIDDLERGERPAEVRTRLRKLAFISVVYDQMEYALECLRRAKKLGPGPADPGNLYDRFLDELEACAGRVPPLFPPSFKERFTLAQSHGRFAAQAQTAPTPPATGLRARLKKVPLLGPSLRVLKQAMWHGQRILKQSIKRASKSKKSYSEIELLLRRYGLDGQAEKLATRRLAQTPYGRLRAPSLEAAVR